jgi:hypothetical protein
MLGARVAGMHMVRKTLLATAGAACFLVVAPGAALATSPPVIASESVSRVIQTDAGLQAQIAPGAHAAFYQFQVVREPSEYGVEIACPLRDELKATDGCQGPEVKGAKIGYLLSGSGAKSVSFDLAAEGMPLTPGTTYHYRVLAATQIQTEDTWQWETPPAYGADQTFTTPSAETPSIESESASHVTQSDATLEAKINPQDAERGAYYQFQLVANPSEYLSVFGCPAGQAHTVECELSELDNKAGGLPLGKAAAGVQGQAVSLDLAGAGVTLKPGTTYHYRVITARQALSEEGPAWQGAVVAGADQTFTTPPGAPAPAIDSVSVLHVSESDATLEARIDTEGLATSYQFELWSICGGKGACLIVTPSFLPSGLLLGSFIDQSVSLDLNSAGVTLQPGGTYYYSVSATSKAGTTETQTHTLTTPEDVVDSLGATPPSTTTDNNQPGTSSTTSTGSGGSSSTPAGTPLSAPLPKTTKLDALTNAQKLSKALKACKKQQPKSKQAACKQQARNKYAPAAKKYGVVIKKTVGGKK